MRHAKYNSFNMRLYQYETYFKLLDILKANRKQTEIIYEKLKTINQHISPYLFIQISEQIINYCAVEIRTDVLTLLSCLQILSQRFDTDPKEYL